MPEMHLKQLGFTKSKEKLQKFIAAGDLRYLSKRTKQSFLSTWYRLWKY